jgi:hypothetical protein
MKFQNIGHLALTLTLLVVCDLSVAAQDHPVWQSAVGFPDGTTVKLGVGVIPPDRTDIKTVGATVTARKAAEGSAALSFVRILKLADNRALVYEVRLTPLEERSRFEVRLRPIIPTAEEAKQWQLESARVDFNFLRNYTKPLLVNNGDTLAIDVLGNPRTGARLVDYFLISNKPPVEEPVTLESLAAQARPLAIEDIELTVMNFELRRNGESIYKTAGGVRGRFIWIDIPAAGRFHFSLQERARLSGYDQPAYVTGHQLTFVYGSDRYEIVTKDPIIPASGVFNIWMRMDPTFGSNSSPPYKGSADRLSFGAANDPPQ